MHVQYLCTKIIFRIKTKLLGKMAATRICIVHEMFALPHTEIHRLWSWCRIVREHPFNLRGRGAMVFIWEIKFLSANLMEKYFLSLDMAQAIVRVIGVLNIVKALGRYLEIQWPKKLPV